MKRLEGKLTPLHWAFYNIVASRGQDGIGIKELAEMLEFDVRSLEEERYSSNTETYVAFHTMKEEINNSMEVDKIIIIKGYRYRIGTEEEVSQYHERLYQRGIDYLGRAAIISQKMRQHNQGKTVNNQNNPMNKNNEEFHNAYLEEEHESDNQ